MNRHPLTCPEAREQALAVLRRERATMTNEQAREQSMEVLRWAEQGRIDAEREAVTEKEAFQRRKAAKRAKQAKLPLLQIVDFHKVMSAVRRRQH